MLSYPKAAQFILPCQGFILIKTKTLFNIHHILDPD